MKNHLIIIATLVLAACESASVPHISVDFEQHQITCRVETPSDCEKAAREICGCNPEATTIPCSKFEKIDWNKPGYTDALHVLAICRKSQ